MHFKISSAIRFNLDHPKILSSGNVLRNLVACTTIVHQDQTAQNTQPDLAEAVWTRTILNILVSFGMPLSCKKKT